ncbi:hypothetical protein [Ammoniphilus sp. CFH 90114]|uniref:hypothetical protein n=1 Tax=Ammoniphilus sp. CFH 90114 TaxID=2493665 RepID=UPI0013E98B12|nr:hypothetical protein [Ammoniphilus sp. CFH 90114]
MDQNNKESFKEAQDKVEDMSADLVTVDTLLAVLGVGAVVIAIWYGVWSVYTSRL